MKKRRLLKPKQTSKNKGFTLTEMLVVISIISILAVLAIPAFNEYERRNALRLMAEDIHSFLRQGQSLAIGPRVSNIESYQFRINENQRKFYLMAVKKDGSQTVEKEASFEIRTVINNMNKDTISFKVPGGAIEDQNVDFVEFLIGINQANYLNKRCVRVDTKTRNIEISRMFRSADEGSQYNLSQCTDDNIYKN